MSDQILIKIDPDLKKALERLSRAEGKTTSGMVRELIRDYVKQRDIGAYIDRLWDRIGDKLRTRGARAPDVAKAVDKVREDSR